MTDAVVAEGLVKTFKGGVRALDGVDLECPRAPCSACSARTARARRRPCASWRRCCAPTPAGRRSPGYDVVKDAAQLRRVIGLSGQYAAVDENLTGRENL